MSINLSKGNNEEKPTIQSTEKKGFNLNKSGDESKNKLSLEKGGLSNASKEKNINLVKPKESAATKPISSKEKESKADSANTAESVKDNGAKKKPVALILAVAICLIGVGYFWFQSERQAVVSPPTDKPIVDDSPSGGLPESPGPAPASPPNKDSIKLNPPLDEFLERPTHPSPITSKSIEENARKVIRGDFGIGRERKRALGSEYSAIQAKVNELYKNKK